MLQIVKHRMPLLEVRGVDSHVWIWVPSCWDEELKRIWG